VNSPAKDEHVVRHSLERTLRQPAMSRQEFLKTLSLGVAGTLALMAESPLFGQVAPQTAGAGPAAKPPTAAGAASGDLEGFLASEEAFFQEFARTLLLDPAVPYFAAGQKGTQPRPILERFKEGLDQIARDPFPVYLEPSATTRAKIAKSYGARVDEIAISRNTTDGVSQILNGIAWQRGDEILASTMEYPNCVATILRVAGRYGLALRQFGLPIHREATGEDILASIQRQINPGKTKVLFFSAPIQPHGIMMPVRRIAHLAQRHGITTVVDGAHYGGQFVPQLDGTGIDFWAISGHKWQCGPGGTGILYVRNAAHPANPGPLPRFHLIRSGDLHAPTDGSRPANFDIGAALSLYGFPESADWRALGEVCELWDLLGRQRIQDYILALADYCRQKIISAFGEEAILQPMADPELKCGIVAFNPFPKREQRMDTRLGQQFEQRLFDEHRVHVGGGGLGPNGLTRLPNREARAFPDGCVPNRDPVTGRPAPTPFPIRVNTPVWIRRDQVDQFVGACQEVVKELASS